MERKLTLGLVWSSIVRTTKSIGKAVWKLIKNIGLLAFSAVFIILLAIYTFFDMCIEWIDRKVSAFAQRINPKWFVYIIVGLIVLFVLFFSFSRASAAEVNVFKSDSSVNVEHQKDSIRFDLDVLAQALIFVESGGNDNAKSDISSASGPLQELLIFVDEANRLSDLYKLDTHYDYNDRFDRQKAIDMFMLIQNHHNPDNSFIRAVTLHRGFFSPKYYAAVGEQYDTLMHELGYEGTYTDLK